MKNLVIMLVLLSSTLTLAQRPNGHGQRNRGPQQMAHYKDFTAQQIATLETKKLTLMLDLSANQQEKIQAINLEIATNRKAMHDQRQAQKQDNTSRQELSSEQRYAKLTEQLDQRIAIKAKFKEILNDQQYERWEKLQKQKHQQRRQRTGRRR